MDSLDFFNSIAEIDYKTQLSQSLTEGFKSVTFTYFTLLKIFSNTSKKLCLSPFLTNFEVARQEKPSLFQAYLGKVQEYSRDIETMGKALLENLALEIDPPPRGIPVSLVGLIEEAIEERKLVMKGKVEVQGPSNNYVRQLNSIATIIEGLVDLDAQKKYKKKKRLEKEANDKQLQVINHLNGKIRYKGNVENNIPHGLGFSNHYNGNLEYKGQWQNGQMCSKAAEIFHFNSNLKWKGAIDEGVISGHGELYHPNGCAKHIGWFHNGFPYGPDCELFWDNGNSLYQGPIPKSEDQNEPGRYEGYGHLYHKNGNLEFEGNFMRGGPDGDQCLTYYDTGQVKYRGKCIAGIYEGFGCLWNKRGYVEYKGFFKDGKPFEDYEKSSHSGSDSGSVKKGHGFDRDNCCNKSFEDWIKFKRTDENDGLFDYGEEDWGETYYPQKLGLDQNVIINIGDSNYTITEDSIQPEVRNQTINRRIIINNNNGRRPSEPKTPAVKTVVNKTITNTTYVVNEPQPQRQPRQQQNVQNENTNINNTEYVYNSHPQKQYPRGQDTIEEKNVYNTNTATYTTRPEDPRSKQPEDASGPVQQLPNKDKPKADNDYPFEKGGPVPPKFKAKQEADVIIFS
jgi:antitoxin component YwqK of YwqJK toxin-antitoxin module